MSLFLFSSFLLKIYDVFLVVLITIELFGLNSAEDVDFSKPWCANDA